MQLGQSGVRALLPSNSKNHLEQVIQLFNTTAGIKQELSQSMAVTCRELSGLNIVDQRYHSMENWTSAIYMGLDSLAKIGLNS